MQIEPYLVLNDIEVANAHRTLSYLRQGLAGPHFDVCAASPLNVGEGTGYQAGYGDIYGGDLYDVRNLCCYCRTFDFGNYKDPAYDAAPWYDADRPESNDFLGMIPSAVIQPVVQRAVVQRVRGRADIGPPVRRARILQVRGFVYAASKAGMHYGEAWLRRVLAGGATGCSGDVLTLLPACAPDEVEDDESYLRELADVGIVDGPTFGEAERNVPECSVQTVAFQLAAGVPELRRTTNLRLNELGVTEVCTPMSASVIADAAPIITITTGGGALDNVVITGKSGACPVSVPPDVEFTINALPAGRQLVIDASRETVQVLTLGGTVVGGMNYLLFDGLFEFMVAAAGTDYCICIDPTSATGTTGVQVRIDQVDLEL